MSNDDQGGKIAYDDVASLVNNAVMQSKGVYKLTGGLTDSIPLGLLGIDNAGKGIKISKNDDGLVLDLHVIVEYETKIPHLAWEIQAAVKESIETATQQKVAAVNIHVQGVHLPGEEED